MSVWDELAGDLRGVVQEGVVTAVYDGGQAQTVDVITHDGFTRGGIEVMQPHGFAGAPIAQGAICLLIAVGGDPANLRALPLARPATRLGGLGAGDAAVYASDGSRVHVQATGTVEVWGGSLVVVHAPTIEAYATGSALVQAPTITLQGHVVVEGNLTVTGTADEGGGVLTINANVQVDGNVNATGTVDASHFYGPVN